MRTASFLHCNSLTHAAHPVKPCSNLWRTTSEEKRYEERVLSEDAAQTYTSIRRAAEVHRQVRAAARKHIRPGMTMTEIANYIEDGTRALVEEDGLESGVGFPTGLSRNECAAHYTPNAGDTGGASVSLSPPGRATRGLTGRFSQYCRRVTC